MNIKKAQQEMVGFILIVVLVVVILMLFLVMRANKPIESTNSRYAQNIMTAVLEYTTECVVAEPERLNVRKLIAQAYSGKKCVNLNRDSVDYLNETIVNIMSAIMASDPTITFYHLNVAWTDDDYGDPIPFYEIYNGVCNYSSSMLLNGGSPDSKEGEIVRIDENLNLYFEICVEQLDG